MANEFTIQLGLTLANGYDQDDVDGSGQFNQNNPGRWGGDLNVAALTASQVLVPNSWQPMPPATCATTAALPANTYANGTSGVGATLTGNSNGALAAIDGHSPSAGDLVFVQNEATEAHNGLYVVTQVGNGSEPYILTRSTSMDVTGDFVDAVVFVEEGTVNAGLVFVCTNALAPTVGTTAITFAQAAPGTEIPYGSVSTPGFLVLINLDETNFVHLGPVVAGIFMPAHKLKPGEPALVRVDPGVVLAAVADTAALLLSFRLYQD